MDTNKPIPTPRGRGYEDGLRGLPCRAPFPEPENQQQKSANDEYKKGWNVGREEYRRVRR